MGTVIAIGFWAVGVLVVVWWVVRNLREEKVTHRMVFNGTTVGCTCGWVPSRVGFFDQDPILELEVHFEEARAR